MRRITATVEGPPMRSETTSTGVSTLALLPLPNVSSLSQRQTEGTICVWCGAGLVPYTARDLGPRPGPGETQIFPRGCGKCVRKKASDVYKLHVSHCEACLRNESCPHRTGLRILASDSRRGMFVHSDRLPTVPALPQGLETARPWGLGRMAPYPTMSPAYTRAALDPATQTAVFCDAFGQVLEMGKHGTSTGTNPATGTSPDGQGGGDTDTGNDTDQ
ncbi:putative ATP-grasp-modified RiPP [Streptomyces sp. NPDC057838]|uniref:putative ATP-grasp-modified RiPP n=1 Tax=unclassified Streptomyces TaxID=2593676 RepID=UPI0036CC8628